MKPLQDLLVIELATMVTASLATMMMADQGARVIKIEPIEGGDPMRYLGHNKGNISALFANCNRGKESICVDLKQQAGQELVTALMLKADVVISNFRPGVMDQLNLGSEALRAKNPDLIYCAITGFGTDGPMADAPAYDPIMQAHLGFADVQRDDEPALVKNLVCDKVTAYTACQAVTAALLVREKTGVGQHIDISMMDAGLFFLFPDGYMAHTLLDEDQVAGPEIRDGYRSISTSDGEITISAATQKQVLGIVKAIGRTDLLEQENLPALIELVQDRPAFRELYADAIADMTTEQALKRLREADVPSAKCLDAREVLDHPQLAANDTIEVIQHPLMGEMRTIRSPTRFGGEQLPLSKNCPALGEDTYSVMQELGLSADEIRNLEDNKTIGKSAQAFT
ncbi:MAG: CoA transferase [Pseudomonadales bacterium]|nr:CoA transferase [Pseudomonadales bacterium]